MDGTRTVVATDSQVTVGPRRWQLFAAFAAVYLIWGSTYLAIRFAIETLPPFLMSGVRFLVAGVMMIAWARSRGASWPTRLQWRSAAIVGTLLLAGGNGGVTWGEQFVPSGLTALMIATVPLWVVVLDWLRPGGRRPAPAVFVGVGLGLAGLALLVGPGQLGGAVHPVGAAVVLLAALLWSVGTVYGNRADLPDAPLMASGVEMFSGALVLVAAGLITGETARLALPAVTLRSWLSMLYLIVFGSLVGFTCYSWLIRNAPPAQTATYAYVNPIVAVFLGWALADEVLTGRMLVGAVVTVLGVAIITAFRGRRRRQERRRATARG